jgi:1-pyrroline-5-carboxylate dehydrogenase
LKAKLAEMKSQVIEVPMFIGSEELKEGKKLPLTSPHDHQHVLGYYYEGDASHVNKAIDSSLAAREKWANMSWEHRVSIFLKAADLSASKYRMELNLCYDVRTIKKCFPSRN